MALDKIARDKSRPQTKNRGQRLTLTVGRPAARAKRKAAKGDPLARHLAPPTAREIAARKGRTA